MKLNALSCRLIAGASALAFAAPACAAWLQARSPHFVIYADEKPEPLRDFATKLERFDQAVRSVRGMPDPPVGDAGRVTVYVLKNETAVSKLATGKKTGIAGFYIPNVRGSVAFVPDITGTDEESAAITFFHEYSHHLMLQNLSAAFPAWYVEGFAEFYATANIKRDGSVELGRPAEHRVYGLFQLPKPPIEQLLASSFDETDGERMEILYSRSWLLTHFLAFDPGRKAQQGKYIEAMQSGQASTDAARAVFGDLGKLDRELDAYLRRNRFTYLTVAGPSLKVGAIDIRPLTPGEAATLPVRSRLARGMMRDPNKDELASLARQVAAQFPADKAAQATLASVELELDNFAAADAAASKALALDPKYAPALIYKGRAQLELTLDKSDAERRAVRNWFLKANELDAENPEPLMLFYQSFRYSGEKPTPNAVAALMYALELAPQDPNLRIMAATQLLMDKKPQEARSVLATLAYSPHPDSGRAYARKLIDAINRGDKDPLRMAGQDAASEEGQ